MKQVKTILPVGGVFPQEAGRGEGIPTGGDVPASVVARVGLSVEIIVPVGVSDAVAVKAGVPVVIGVPVTKPPDPNGVEVGSGLDDRLRETSKNPTTTAQRPINPQPRPPTINLSSIGI